MALARRLLERLGESGLALPKSALEPMRKWFDERVFTSDEAKEFRAEIKTGAKAESGIPFFATLFARFTASFRANATYKDSLRRVIRNHFTELADAFKTLLRQDEAALAKKHGQPVRILFLLDGTDKMRHEDTQQFFVFDAEQLLAIEAFILYTAPLNVKYEGNLAQKLDADLVLPMIKLAEADGTPCAAGRMWASSLATRRSTASSPPAAATPESCCACSSSAANTRKTASTPRPWTAPSPSLPRTTAVFSNRKTTPCWCAATGKPTTPAATSARANCSTTSR
jgi:hypothetical protein